MGRHPTGIDRVCLAYLERYAGEAQAVVQHRRLRRILDPAASSALFALLAKPRTDFRAAFVRSALRFGFRQGCGGGNRLYLNIGHTGLDDPGFARWIGETGVRSIYFVHDVIPITHPEFCRAGEREKHERRMRTVLATGFGVIGNSQATLDELARFAEAEGRPVPNSVAAWLGTTPLPASPAQPAPEKQTFVTLGTIEARKNHLFLLQLWARLIARRGADAPRLLVIGQRGWEAEEAIRLLDDSAVLSGHVEEIGGCDDATLARHLAGARALLFPSLAEGYGLPLIESLQAGTPAIASDLPIFREIGQGVPDLIDPLDTAAWEAAVLDYAGPNSSPRDAQLRRLQSFRAPSWADHFAKVDSWLAGI